VTSNSVSRSGGNRRSGEEFFLSNKRNGTASHEARYDVTERKPMLWTIFVILLILWLLGLVSSYTLGGFIHILLVLAIIVLIINLIQGRRPL
jgi:uncharacterized protein DUF5670